MKNLIGNDWKDSSNSKIVQVLNPATEELIDTVPNSTVDDVVITVNLAKEAQPNWENLSLRSRADILTKFASLVKEGKEELAGILTEESGKTYKEAIEEMDCLYHSTLAFVERGKHLYGSSLSSGIENSSDQSLQFTIREPIGIVGVILPGIFKLDAFASKVVSALIMGNAVIVKPSRKTPLTVTKLVYMLRQAGVYEAIVQVIHGDGKTVGQAIAMHPDVNLIAFNGSTASGIRVMGSAAKNMSKTLLTLSGNNAFVLCKDGDVDLAVEEAVKSRFYNAGQLNTANKRFLIHSTLKEIFINKLIEKIDKITLGLPSDKDTDLGCLISEAAALKVEKQVNDMIDKGAKLVVGGRRNGAFYEPTIISNVAKDMAISSNLDILGPVISIIEFDNLTDAVNIVNQSVYGCGTSIFTRNIKVAMKMAALIKNGSIVINGSTLNYGSELASEGWRYSGFGRTDITALLEEMSRVKVISLKDVLS